MDIYNPYGRKSFIHPITLFAQRKEYQSKALGDTGTNAFLFINGKKAQLLSDYLDILSTLFAKPRYLFG